MVKKAHPQTATLRLAIVLLLFLGLAAAGTAAEAPSEEGQQLYDYLDQTGIELDCYFTIEEMPREQTCWIVLQKIKGAHASSVGQLVSILNKQLKGVHAYRSDENRAVVHLIDIRLEKEMDYTLNKRVNINYSGPMQELVDHLHSMYFDNLRSQNQFVIGGGWPPLVIDYKTTTVCAARDMSVRRILSDFVPLSQYQRVMWTANSRATGGALETKFQYLGPAPHRIWWCVSQDPLTFQPHYLGEPRVNELFPFDAGQVAYANNEECEGLKTNPNDDLDEQAVSFIRARMQAGQQCQVRWAMLFLGKRQAKAGVPTLLKYLDYRYTTCGVLEESYPAVRALTMIGPPAADAAFQELLDHDQSDLRVRLLTAAVRAVNGYHPTRDALEKALADAKDDPRKKRLELALKWLKDEE